MSYLVVASTGCASAYVSVIEVATYTRLGNCSLYIYTVHVRMLLSLSWELQSACLSMMEVATCVSWLN